MSTAGQSADFISDCDAIIDQGGIGTDPTALGWGGWRWWWRGGYLLRNQTFFPSMCGAWAPHGALDANGELRNSWAV